MNSKNLRGLSIIEILQYTAGFLIILYIIMFIIQNLIYMFFTV